MAAESIPSLLFTLLDTSRLLAQGPVSKKACGYWLVAVGTQRCVPVGLTEHSQYETTLILHPDPSNKPHVRDVGRQYLTSHLLLQRSLHRRGDLSHREPRSLCHTGQNSASMKTHFQLLIPCPFSGHHHFSLDPIHKAKCGFCYKEPHKLGAENADGQGNSC